MPLQTQLLAVYQLLYQYYGDRHWWPAESAEEVVIGAILVQNVAWTNVEKAIAQLRELDLLTFQAIDDADFDNLAQAVRPTRFYRSKAVKLKAFATYLGHHYAFKLDNLFSQSADALRQELLGIHGIGPETADDIVLYAAGLPSFVVDAYTKRVFHRLGFTPEAISYEDLRSWFMEHLPMDTALYNQFHALIDAHGHTLCTARHPACDKCPLAAGCQEAAARA